MRSPFVVGQWVRGARFYGRNRELAELLDRGAAWTWIVGLRRIGKTSLLRQLEHLAVAADRPLLPLFWDLQGAADDGDLGPGLGDALGDAAAVLEKRGVGSPEVEGGDPFDALARLADEAARRDLALLLLLDEAEELIALPDRTPAFLAKLDSTFMRCAPLRVVMASSPRLPRLVAGHAPHWLGRFPPPRLLGALTAEETRSLVVQDLLPEPARPRFAPDVVAGVVAESGGHPFLAQLLAKRCDELGDLDEARLEVAADPSLAHLFAIDGSLLTAEERGLLRSIARDARAPACEATDRLVALGCLRQSAWGPEVASPLLAAWLRAQP